MVTFAQINGNGPHRRRPFDPLDKYVRAVRGVLKGLGVLLVLALSAVAVLLTTSRLLEPAGAQWIQAEAFTPYAILAYAVLLIAALIGLIRSRQRSGRIAMSACAVIAVAGLGAHVAWFLPQVNGSVSPPADGSPVLVVMTFNEFAGNGNELSLLEAAAEAEADVLVVQEITPPSLQRLEAAGLDEVFPYRAGDPIDGVFGTMVFSQEEVGEVIDLPTEMSSFAVSVQVAGRKLDLVAAHPAPPTEAEQWRADHRALGDWVQENEPDLLAGDFNATADHPPMRSLTAAGYRSVTELTNEGWQPTWPSNQRLFGVLPVPPLVQIDHVICGPQMTALGSRTVRIEDSDHRAVVAEIAYR